MRRLALSASVLVTAAVLLPLAAPATAAPDLVRVRNDDGGVGVSVGQPAHPIVAVNVNYYSETVCVTVGFKTTCSPDLT